MKIKNTFHLIFIYSLFLVGCSTDDGGGEMDNTNTTPEPTPITPEPTPKETFGNWSPDFTNQTSDFTQTRTGSQGTQQTRTINVTSSSVTTSSTEESINQDLNDDGDLFEEIEEVITTYTGSENLGNHQTKTYNVTEDNNNGILIGNEFISMKFGYIEYDGEEYFCDLNNNYSHYVLGLNSIGSNFNDNNFYGNGYLIEYVILLKTDNLDSEGKLIPDQNYDLPYFFEVINNTFDQNITNFEELDLWEKSHFIDSDGDSYNDLTEIFNNGDPNDPNIYIGDESVWEYFCDLNGGLLLEEDNLVEDMILYYIENGNYGPDGSETNIFTTNTSIILNSNSGKYLLKGEGTTETGLPVKMYFNGFISLHDFTSKSSKSMSNKKNKHRLTH